MFCTRCGKELQNQDSFCSQCGNSVRGVNPAATADPRPVYQNKLSRMIDQKKIAGVCAGVARYLNVDVTLVRIAWLILALWPPSLGFIAYLIAWIVMPRDPRMIEAPARTAQQSA